MNRRGSLSPWLSPVRSHATREPSWEVVLSVPTMWCQLAQATCRPTAPHVVLCTLSLPLVTHVRVTRCPPPNVPNTFTQSVYPFSHSALTQHLYLSFLVAGPLARKHFERRTHVVPLGHVSSNSKDLRSSNAVRRSVIKGRLSPGEHRSICMRPSAGRALSRGHAGVRRIVV